MSLTTARATVMMSELIVVRCYLLCYGVFGVRMDVYYSEQAGNVAQVCGSIETPRSLR